MPESVEHWATRFLGASDGASIVSRPSSDWPDMSLEDAYRIQQKTIELRLARGEVLRAIKLGLADPAEQIQWSTPHPTWGSLTDSMLLETGQEFSLARGITPRAEAEIVVVLGRTLTEAPGTLEEFLPTIASVHAGIEILDSRFEAAAFHPVDAVADNQSALSGTWSHQGQAPHWAQLAAEDVVVTANGEVVLTSRDPRTRPHPLESVYRAITDRINRGLAVTEGLTVFSGNLLPKPVAMGEGDRIQVAFTTLGTLAIDVVA
jgi:2-oxo-3-hexenedioate decarboxylase